MLPWIVLGIVVLALNLRAPIIAPTAILPRIQEGTGFSSAGLGLLTGLPVFLFALATPVAGRFITRLAPRPRCWPACRGCWPEPCCDRPARPGWCSWARASSV